jgi:carboxyl-terminal processing protease
VDAVSKIADLLLPEGLVVSTVYNDGSTVERTSDASRVNVPMAVLINGATASASEILAGALQDYKAAVIVGSQSYGKGIVQSTLDLRDGTALKLTTAKYYTPNGNNIHGIGITPDVEIDLPEELKTEVTLSMEEDVQLQKAIEVLQQ